MDNPLWDPLPVEVCELLYEDMVLEQQRPPRSHAEAVELVPHWGPVSRGEAVWILNEKISQQFQDSFSLVGFFPGNFLMSYQTGFFRECGLLVSNK